MTTQSITIDQTEFPVIVYKNLRVVTTELLAQAFGTDKVRIRQNHSNNKDRFIEGKHFFKIVGEELKEFASSLKILTNFSKVRSLILWTDRGAARHAKMLETDAAWDMFEKMEDCYFGSTKPQYGLKQLPLQKTKKALPGCLTMETQDDIKQLINNRAARLPKDKQAGAVISLWSALGTHFGVKKQDGDKIPAYKRIPEGARLECLSLIARLSIDDLVTLTLAEFDQLKALPKPEVKTGEVMPEANGDLVGILTSRIKTLEGELLPKECPKYSAPISDLNVSNRRGGRTGWLTYPELKKQNCLYKLLQELKRDNHDVEGAIEEFNGQWLLLNDFHHRLDVMKGVLEAIDRCGRNVTFN